MDKVFLTIIFTGISQTSLGSPILTCFDVDPTSTSTAQCFCHNPGGIGIIWHRDTTYLTQCTKSNEQCFTSTGYAFAVNSTTSTYTIDVESYSYTDCSSVSCSDSTTPTDSDLKTISVDDFNMNSTNLTIDEPSTSHTNGNISFTTDCLYKARTTNVIVTAKLTAVTEKGNHILEVDDSISEIGSCQSCSYDFASKFLIEFYHEEDQSKDKQKAHILIELFIDGNPVSSQNNMTNNVYYVRGQNNASISNTESSSISPAPVTSVTTGTGTNLSAYPTSISSVSIQRDSSPTTTLPYEGENSITHIMPLIIAAPCVVLTYFSVLFCYCIALKRTKKPKLENQTDRFHQSKYKHYIDQSQSTAL